MSNGGVLLRRQEIGKTFAEISARAKVLYHAGIAAVLFAVLGAAVWVGLKNPANLVPFLLIAGPGLGGLLLWNGQRAKGVPILPLILIQQMLIYALPLVGKFANEVDGEVLRQSCVTTAVFLGCVIGGWTMGRQSGRGSFGSRWPFSFAIGPDHQSRTLNLSLLLLAAGVAFHISTRTGILYKFLPGQLWRAFPIIRAFSDVACIFGALLGSLTLGELRYHPRAVLFWGLVAAVFFLSIADVLISGATGLVLATVVGLSLGKGKIPWVFLIICGGAIGFLNQGKFQIREKYWGEGLEGTHLKLRDLPSFYVEWASASADHFQRLWDPNYKTATLKEDTGQSILERVNNLQMLVYVVDATGDEKNIPLLMGKTYSLIPPLLVPRILWPGKPRTHEGQVLLNLHFKRQSGVEDTKKTYIAWGLLPEAVGNFGIWGGPIILGLFLGGGMGIIERLSLNKLLLSIEGLVLCALVLKLCVSFEMVASVLVTSTFQFMVAVLAIGIFFRFWFGAPPPMRVRTQPIPGSV